MPVPKILKELLRLPTATFCETAVLDHIATVCRGLKGVQLRADRYGNLLARYRNDPSKRVPLVFVAHADHPGFVAQEMLDRRTLRAAFRGGVKPEYLPGSRVRFWTANRWVKGRVLEVTKLLPVQVPGWTGRPEEAHVKVPEAVMAGAPGMWDLPEPAVRGDRLLAPVCDDLAGVGAMLALLERLSRRQARAETYCLFTRAEEVGFVGALGAIQARTVAKNLPIFSIETSSTLPTAPVGAGPIVRVGDRGTVFTPQVTAFCERVAQGLAKRRKDFTFQRKLMDGGMCEAHAFIAYGYTATGICLALGNYHNMDTARGKIDREYISLTDWNGMVELFAALVLDEQGLRGADSGARDVLDERFAKFEALLLE